MNIAITGAVVLFSTVVLGSSIALAQQENQQEKIVEFKELKRIVPGATMHWTIANGQPFWATFHPDGTSSTGTKSLSGDTIVTYQGTWSIRGTKVCRIYAVSNKGQQSMLTACTTIYRTGDKFRADNGGTFTPAPIGKKS